MNNFFKNGWLKCGFSLIVLVAINGDNVFEADSYTIFRPESVRRNLIKRQTKGCDEDQFRCDYGGCISNAYVCDGFQNCRDGTDETAETCKNRACDDDQRRCNYGGCISNTYVCDGLKNCWDGTDETWERCHNKRCDEDYFQCKYGGCLQKGLLCDGTEHCMDGSDESIENCGQKRCAANEFRCDSGICIDSSLKCNEKEDCEDGSDESYPSCKSLPSSCLLPKVPENGEYTVVECPGHENCPRFPGNEVFTLSKLNFTCNKGYWPDFFVTRCFENGKWGPKFDKCRKVCDPLKHIGVDLTCPQHLAGKEIPCSGPIVENTIVRASCKPNYRSVDKKDTDSSFLFCESDGTWNRMLHQCEPVCGTSTQTDKALIAYGTRAQRREAPWHVAIYETEGDESAVLICGGTIISEDLIVSAAHCFYDNANERALEAERFRLAVAKMTRNYTSKDTNETTFYNVTKISFNPRLPYNGDTTHFTGDIAILQTSEKIIFKEQVLPACVQWKDTSPYNPGVNTTGQLVGFGKDENDTFPDALLVGCMPYISYADCIKTVDPSFRSDVSSDQFCAGVAGGVGAREGDSGGGLVFRDPRTELYYLRGIASNKDTTNGRNVASIATFTDLNQHVNWINEVRKNITSS